MGGFEYIKSSERKTFLSRVTYCFVDFQLTEYVMMDRYWSCGDPAYREKQTSFISFTSFHLLSLYLTLRG